jgi:hypothetical protein
MPESPFRIRLDPSREFTRSTAELQDTVFVDVGERVIDAQVVRDGIDVGVFEIDDVRLDDIIGGRRPINQRVVGQSIVPGVAVAVGTAVNLVVANTVLFPAGVITGVLTEVADQPLGELHQRLVVNHPEDTDRILSKVGAGNTLPPAEEARLRAVFEAENIAIGDEPGNDLGAAVATLRAAKTFGA